MCGAMPRICQLIARSPSLSLCRLWSSSGALQRICNFLIRNWRLALPTVENPDWTKEELGMEEGKLALEQCDNTEWTIYIRMRGYVRIPIGQCESAECQLMQA
ncbi:hypothetical protein DPX16_8856 [Anabarilius grahami]|uniref:Uncharacterized protein n=1 Tax=Anabarilius grahami TaxID=495550 RepID=A0A3N0YED2_ANAGA|nr:hypothetical protein DPX16_8856 [Anabarilius grahami]